MKKEEHLLVVVRDIDGREIRRLVLTTEEALALGEVLPKLEKCEVAKTLADTKECVCKTATQLYDIKASYRKTDANINYVELHFVNKIKKDK